MDWNSDFQPFSSHATHKLITKILWHRICQKYIIFFANLTTILIHSHQRATAVLAIVIVLFDNLREKRSVPLTTQSGIVCFKNSCALWLKFTGLKGSELPTEEPAC